MIMIAKKTNPQKSKTPHRNLPREKAIGIIGGMGPLATAYLFQKIIELTPAKKDQDHLRVIIDNNPKIPDRTQSILKKDKKIISYLKRSARILQKAGAQCIVIPCNASHHYIEEIQKSVRIPVLDMVRAAVKSVDCGGGKIGLLATDGTLKAEIYQKYDVQSRIHWITLKTTEQKELMRLIYSIKAGRGHQDLKPAFKKLLILLKNKGAKLVILGCTELSLFKEMFGRRFNLIDPVEIIALQAVKFSKPGF